VRLVFVAGSIEQAGDLAEPIVSQLEAGAINIVLTGVPNRVTEQ
jgi:hypothetical protein